MIERKTKTMDYRRFGNTIVARFDRDEEVTTCVKKIALAEDIKLANVSGLGAANDITIGVFDPAQKKLIEHHFTGNHEVSGIINLPLPPGNGQKEYSCLNFRHGAFFCPFCRERTCFILCFG